MCEDGYFMNQNGKCVEDCKRGIFGDDLVKECLSCPQGCLDCASMDVCYECDKKYQFNSAAVGTLGADGMITGANDGMIAGGANDFIGGT